MKRFSTPLEALNEVFGYETFRGFQQDVIDAVVQGQDALVLMPTGGGKSLCYQIPALLRDGVAVVISPLIALMQNQVDALDEVGVRAAFLNSTQTSEQVSSVYRALRNGELDLLYVAPERLMSGSMLDFLHSVKVSLFAIDEAHCVSSWGHDFRPEYGELDVLKEQFPGVPRIALTATADEKTREEIVKRLLKEPRLFVSSFDRPNIFYRIVDKRDVRDLKEQLLRFIRYEHPNESGVVYCLARKTTEEIAEFLCQSGVKALPYHAKLEPEVRMANQATFLQEDDVVIVATVAFGMGIDKPNVRFVAHVDMPKSIESYFQETGRAGRDGLPADAWMAYGLRDVVNQRFFIESSEADEFHKQICTQKLDAMLGLAEEPGCRRQRLLAYFGEKTEPCGHCDNCQNPPDLIDMSIHAQKFLSCIYRAQQASGRSFGAGHIIAVLRGEMTDRIAQLSHDQLSTWGIGKDLSGAEWRTLLRQLIARHVVWIDAFNFNALRLGEQAPAVLRGELAIKVRKRSLQVRRKKVASGANQALVADLSRHDQALFEKLRQWRRSTADAISRPAYVIFSDVTLIALAKTRPSTMQELAEIQGVGAKKLERYGEDVLSVIAQGED